MTCFDPHRPVGRVALITLPTGLSEIMTIELAAPGSRCSPPSTGYIRDKGHRWCSSGQCTVNEPERAPGLVLSMEECRHSIRSNGQGDKDKEVREEL